MCNGCGCNWSDFVHSTILHCWNSICMWVEIVEIHIFLSYDSIAFSWIGCKDIFSPPSLHVKMEQMHFSVEYFMNDLTINFFIRIVFNHFIYQIIAVGKLVITGTLVYGIFLVNLYINTHSMFAGLKRFHIFNTFFYNRESLHFWSHSLSSIVWQ